MTNERIQELLKDFVANYAKLNGVKPQLATLKYDHYVEGASDFADELERLAGSGEPPQPRCPECKGAGVTLVYLENSPEQSYGLCHKEDCPSAPLPVAQFFGPSPATGQPPQQEKPKAEHVCHLTGYRVGEGYMTDYCPACLTASGAPHPKDCWCKECLPEWAAPAAVPAHESVAPVAGTTVEELLKLKEKCERGEADITDLPVAIELGLSLRPFIPRHPRLCPHCDPEDTEYQKQECRCAAPVTPVSQLPIVSPTQVLGCECKEPFPSPYKHCGTCGRVLGTAQVGLPQTGVMAQAVTPVSGQEKCPYEGGRDEIMSLAEKWNEYRIRELKAIALGNSRRTVDDVNDDKKAFYAGAEAYSAGWSDF